MTGRPGPATVVRAAAVGAARGAVKAVAAAADGVRRPAAGITILIYHRVGAGSGGQMDLSPAVFDDQLAWLTATQRVLALDAALDELAAGAGVEAGVGAGMERGTESGAEPGVVLTFDDGTADWVEHVLPALARHRVPATFYVATAYVDGSEAMPGDARPVSWTGLREMAASDLVTIGSHTHRHRLLDRLPAPEVDDELDRSLDRLGAETGVAARHFAYPKALAGSPAADAAVRRRFRSAVLAGTRANPPGADPYRLSRSPVQAADGRVWFRRKAGGGLRVEDDLRRLANRVRYRGLES